jgi:hypothetical protein
MTPRSLFKIILKIFGLFFLKEIITTFPQFISSLIINIQLGRIEESVFTFAINAIIILFYGFIVFQLLFNTNTILDKFKLDQGFDEEELSFDTTSKNDKFSIAVSASLVLTIAVFVVAGVILTNEIPNVCKHIFTYLLLSRTNVEQNASFIIISIVKILIALLLVGERKRIVEFVVRNQSRTEDVAKEEE